MNSMFVNCGELTPISFAISFPKRASKNRQKPGGVDYRCPIPVLATISFVELHPPSPKVPKRPFINSALSSLDNLASGCGIA
jgi:hypothetical protein